MVESNEQLNNPSLEEGVKKHSIPTPQTMSVEKEEKKGTPTLFIAGDDTYKDREGNIYDENGEMIEKAAKTKITRTYSPEDPLAEFGVFVINGDSYESIVNKLVNNDNGPDFGVHVKGSRLEDNALSGHIFVPTVEEEPYNNQTRIDHAKFKIPAGDYDCLYEIIPGQVTENQWEKLGHLVVSEWLKNSGRYIIKAVTTVEYGKGGVMDDLIIEKPKTQ